MTYYYILTTITITALVMYILFKTFYKCPENKIIHRYIPRTFKEEQDEPVMVSDIFKTMFSQPDIWSIGIAQSDENILETNEKNKYYISQL